MSTYQPPPDPIAPVGQAIPAVPVDPAPNKAILSAALFLIGLLAQWLSTGDVDFDEEGVTALIGAVSTLAVYAVSNWRKFPGVGTQPITQAVKVRIPGDAGYGLVEVAVFLLIIVIALVVLFRFL